MQIGAAKQIYPSLRIYLRHKLFGLLRPGCMLFRLL